MTITDYKRPEGMGYACQILLLIIFIILSGNISAQVGIGTMSPDNSSLLELSSSNSGFLLPRIELDSNTDVTTIPNPAEGLMIYNLSTNCVLAPGIYIYDGSKWRRTSYSDATTYPRLIRDEIGVANVTFSNINTTNQYGPFSSLFNGIDNTGASSFHVYRAGSPTGDWGFGITLPDPYFIDELILNGRNDCCTNRIVNVVIRLYRCGNLIYSSAPISSATTGDNIVSTPGIYADEIRLVVPNGGNTGDGSGIINFSELSVIASD